MGDPSTWSGWVLAGLILVFGPIVAVVWVAWIAVVMATGQWLAERILGRR